MAKHDELFIEDDDQNKNEGQQPAENKPAPAFDPFADSQVSVDETEAADTPAEDASPQSPAAKASGNPPPEDKQPGGFDPFANQPVATPGEAGADPAAAADDPDLKPGSRKDLWACPHCGAKNKPDRDTCRTCSKSPDEAVVPPWYKNPLALGGIAAVLVVLIAYIMISASSVAVEPNPGPETVQFDGPKVVEGGGGSLSVNGANLQAAGSFQLTGRAVHADGAVGEQMLVIAYDRRVTEDERFQDMSFRGGQTIINLPMVGGTDDVEASVVHALGASKAVSKGDWVSLIGTYGDLAGGGLASDPANGVFVVAVEDMVVDTP